VGSAMGLIMLLGAIFILWVLVEYWMIVVPIALTSFIVFLLWKFTE
jgi:Na+-transporting NADH:ubiquinone oxidoreductase subunit NqrB